MNRRTPRVLRHSGFVAKLRRVASDWFASKGVPVDPHYRFQLASPKQWRDNILMPDVADYIQGIHEERPGLFHRDIHSGMSSQAMLFNLLGPLVVRQDYSPLRSVLADAGASLLDGAMSADFEYECREVFNERSPHPTSIDLVFKDRTGAPRVFLEAKFEENGFGHCSMPTSGKCERKNPARNFNNCHLHVDGKRYWTLMDRYGLLAGPIAADATCVMDKHYQFFREMVFALHFGGDLVLLHDERNPNFVRSGEPSQDRLMQRLLELIPPFARAHVHQISIQSVVQAIRDSGRHPWVEDFAKKYGLALVDSRVKRAH